MSNVCATLCSSLDWTLFSLELFSPLLLNPKSQKLNKCVPQQVAKWVGLLSSWFYGQYHRVIFRKPINVISSQSSYSPSTMLEVSKKLLCHSEPTNCHLPCIRFLGILQIQLKSFPSITKGKTCKRPVTLSLSVLKDAENCAQIHSRKWAKATSQVSVSRSQTLRLIFKTHPELSMPENISQNFSILVSLPTQLKQPRSLWWTEIIQLLF